MDQSVYADDLVVLGVVGRGLGSLIIVLWPKFQGQEAGFG